MEKKINIIKRIFLIAIAMVAILAITKTQNVYAADTYKAIDGACTVKLLDNSQITDWDSSSLTEGSYISITSSDSSQIENAKINVGKIDSASGTFTVSNMLEINGTVDFPSGLIIAVKDSTQITKKSDYNKYCRSNNINNIANIVFVYKNKVS